MGASTKSARTSPCSKKQSEPNKQTGRSRGGCRVVGTEVDGALTASAQIEALKAQVGELHSPKSRRPEQKGLPPFRIPPTVFLRYATTRAGNARHGQ